MNLLFSRVRHIVGGGNPDQIPPALKRASPSTKYSNLRVVTLLTREIRGEMGTCSWPARVVSAAGIHEQFVCIQSNIRSQNHVHRQRIDTVLNWRQNLGKKIREMTHSASFRPG